MPGERVLLQGEFVLFSEPRDSKRRPAGGALGVPGARPRDWPLLIPGSTTTLMTAYRLARRYPTRPASA